jgi:hypothetical protein
MAMTLANRPLQKTPGRPQPAKVLSTSEMPLADRIRWAALQAPSAENRLTHTPVWVDPITLELRAVAAYRTLTPELRFLADLCAGTMAENARCMAAAAGFAMTQTWSPQDASGARVSLRLGPDGEKDGLAASIAGRCTNRRPYGRSPLPEAMGTRLAAVGRIAETIRVTTLGPAAKELFAQAAAIAEGARLRSQVLHEGMFSGIRFDAGWTATVAEGIPPGSIEIGLLARPGLRALREWGLCRLLGPLGVAAYLGWRSGTYLAERSAAIIVLDCDLPAEQAAPLVGQAMQRIWLQATAFGLAVQPMAASALFALPWWQGVPEDTRARLADLWPRILPGGRPQMAFRVGYAPAPTVRAGRPPLITEPPAQRNG